MNEHILKLDTGIIGGGIAGLYVCLKLREMKGAGHTIALFETSDRFGGRIETVEMDGFLAEYGPMRFERYGQPLLMQLIRDLRLETCHFPPYTPASAYPGQATRRRRAGCRGGLGISCGAPISGPGSCPQRAGLPP